MKHMKTGMVALVAVAALGILPGQADAQSSDGWWGWALQEVASARSGSIGDVILGRDGGKVGDRRDRRDRGEVDRGGTLGDIILGRRGDDDDRYERRDGRRGPKFCQNGQGHPVHGRSWCRQKGFGVGSSRAIRWEDRGWDDIILGAPRGTDRRNRTVGEGGLIDILGDVVFGRVDRERRRVGGRAPLEGRWLDLRDGGRVLQIRSGSLPVAELSDVNGDRRVDIVLVPRR